MEREKLGKLVREAWVKWAETQPNPKPTWLVPWEGLSEPDKEADRQIGEAVWNFRVAELKGIYLPPLPGQSCTCSSGPEVAHLRAQIAERETENVHLRELLDRCSYEIPGNLADAWCLGNEIDKVLGTDPKVEIIRDLEIQRMADTERIQELEETFEDSERHESALYKNACECADEFGAQMPDQDVGPWLLRNNFLPYEPGQGNTPGAIRMSANENPRGPSPQVVRALQEGVKQGLGIYPQDGAPGLKKDLAYQFGIEACQVYPAGGAAGVIKTICERTLDSSSEMICSSHCFPYYEIAALQQGAKIIKVPVIVDSFADDLEGMLQAVSPNTKALFLASPNNPTGQFIPEPKLRDFLQRVPSWVLVALDLAYIEYADSPYDNEGIGLLEVCPNLVLLRSFSKIHGLASLRVGYGIAGRKVILELEKGAMPFGVNGPASLAAHTALLDSIWVQESHILNKTNRQLLEQGLTDLKIDWVKNPQANFLMAKFGANVSKVWEFLCSKNVFTRQIRVAPEYLRVTVGTEDQCKAFLGALGRRI